MLAEDSDIFTSQIKLPFSYQVHKHFPWVRTILKMGSTAINFYKILPIPKQHNLSLAQFAFRSARSPLVTATC